MEIKIASDQKRAVSDRFASRTEITRHTLLVRFKLEKPYTHKHINILYSSVVETKFNMCTKMYEKNAEFIARVTLVRIIFSKYSNAVT